MHEPQFIGIVVRSNYFEGLAVGLAALLAFGGITAGIKYLECRKGVNPLISLAVFSVIVAFVVFRLGWPR
jgi:hypothetical protein